MGIGMQTLTDYAKGNPSVSIKNEWHWKNAQRHRQ
jgi:hypothetical protein